MPLTQAEFKPSQKSAASTKELSLSAYFPQGTMYFYGYPAGETSGFLNNVPPATEELVAARVYSCAGPGVSVISFASTQPPSINRVLLDKLGIPQLSTRQIVLLPAEIDAGIAGAKRNEMVKAALMEIAGPQSVVMAQPYTDSHMAGIFQIPPALTNWLNDKHNMPQYIPDDLLVKRLAVYRNGSELLRSHTELTLPHVIKASSSSSGDGVYICKTKLDTLAAVEGLKNFAGTIFAEHYVQAVKNYGIHFGIPQDRQAPIDLLGINEQITSADGEFLGGVVSDDESNKPMQVVIERLQNEILPAVRRKGWYGIGNFDVLIDKTGRHYFIDGNFRMTGMSAYHMLIANGILQAPIISFGGEFDGSKADFENRLLPLAATDSARKVMHLITVSRNGRTWRFNGALHFDALEQLRQSSASILASGVRSQALSQILDSAPRV